MEKDNENIILERIGKVISSEWRWETYNRWFNVLIKFGVWTSRLLILMLSTYQITYLKGNSPEWLTTCLVIMAAVNITFPLLAYTIRFEQRQMVHDKNAREYTSMENDFRAGNINLSELTKKFNELYIQPVEQNIKKTP